MTPKLWNVALIGGGLLLIFAGIQQWRTNQKPKETLIAFLDAVVDCDSETALELMTPELRERAQFSVDDFDAAWAAPDAAEDAAMALEYEITALDVRRGHATAKAQFRHAETPFVDSTIELQLSSTGLWRVARVDNRLNAAWRMLENQRLSAELRQSVQELPGVNIAQEPVPQQRTQ